MCLTKVTTTYAKPSDLIVSGWKEFSGTPPKMKHRNFGGEVKLDQWVTATGGNVIASDGKDYQAGFHIYPDDRGVKGGYSFRRVYFRRVTVYGEQDGKECVIAQEMYVPSDPDGWPPLHAATPPPKPGKLMDRIRKTGGQS